MSVSGQAWNPPYEIVDVPSDKVQLAFPSNFFSATIVGDSFQLSISTDLAGLPAVIERLEKLLEFAQLGPMPQRAPFLPREAVAEDIMLPSPDRSGEAIETTKIGSTEGESRK